MHKYGYVYRELPLHQVAEDINQPRQDFGTDGEDNQLLTSIRDLGMEEPLKVCETRDEGRFLLIDGHRRYRCAKKLKLETVPCRIYPPLPAGELEHRRYNMQNNRRPWKPMERAEALERIKVANNLSTNREVAQLLDLAESTVSNSLLLRKYRLGFVEKMEQYELSESCRIEFVRLYSKIRKVKELEASDVLSALFEKIANQVVRNVRDYRVLTRTFLKASAHEDDLYRFLTRPDMTIGDLEHRTSEAGFSMLLEEVTENIAQKQASQTAFTARESAILSQLRTLLSHVAPAA